MMSPPPLPPASAKSHNKDDQKNKGKVTQVKKEINRPKQIVKEKVVAPKKAPTELTLASPSAITDLPSTEVQSLKLEKSNLNPVNSEVFAWREPTVKVQQQNPPSKLELSPSVIRDLPSDNSIISMHLEQKDLKPLEKDDEAFAYGPSKPKPKSTKPQTSQKAKAKTTPPTPALSPRPVLRTSPAQVNVKNSPNTSHSPKSQLPPKVSPKNAAPKANQGTVQRQKITNFDRIAQIEPIKNVKVKKTKENDSPKDGQQTPRSKPTKGSQSPHSPMILPNKRPNDKGKGKNVSRTPPTPTSKPKTKPKATSAGTKYTVKNESVSANATSTGNITDTGNANANIEDRAATKKKNIAVTSKVYKPPPKE